MDWKKITLSQWASISTTILTSLAGFYLKFAEVWNLPLGNEISETLILISALIAGVLGAFTIKKVSSNNEQ